MIWMTQLSSNYKSYNDNTTIYIFGGELWMN